MRLAIHNLLMRLGSPAAHAIFLGLAIAFMAIPAKALDLIVLDDPQCSFCVAFKKEVGASYDTSPNAEIATLSYVTYTVGFQPVPQQWPEWYLDAARDGRTTPARGTPTFILWDIPPGQTKAREVGRWSGYGGPAHFQSNFDAVVKGYKAWKDSQ